MTKYIICLGDGMADKRIKSLENKTPLEAAKTPNMDILATGGQVGLIHTVSEGLEPGSDVTNMGILGYDPHIYYSGRGPIEAAAMGITVPKNQLIFRCNLVTITNNKMIDFTAGHISNEEGADLLNELNIAFEKEATFFPGVGYRNIVLLSNDYSDVKTTAPHDIINQDIASYLPKGLHESRLYEFVQRCQEILAKSPINKKRIQENKPPATSIWPWSQGPMPILPSFVDKYGKTGGIVTAVDLLKGLGKLSGLETPDVEGATGFIDTNYKNKISAGLSILKNHDFLYMHIEAPDECGHMGDETLKIKAIEDFDEHIIGPMLDYRKIHPDTIIMVLPDHPTPCALRTHTSDPVPFIINGPGISPDSMAQYNEYSAKESSLILQKPWELLEKAFSYSSSFVN